MNIKDLKELIADLPDTMEIILSNDAEGNSYSPLEDCVFGYYISENRDFYQYGYSAEDSGFEEEEWEELQKRPKVLSFWP